MKIYGRRRNKSDGTLEPARLLHQTQRHDLGRSLRFFTVGVPPMTVRPGKGNLPVPRAKLIITSEQPDPTSKYQSIELHFSANDTRLIEVLLAQILATRKVRKDARPVTRLTRQQARKRII